MIKAKELRIGNKLYNQNVVVNIDARSIFDIWDDKGLKNYKPIPLTDKWIINLGFKYVGIGEFELKDILIDCEYTDKGEFYFILNGQVINSVYYVHQLQNLYFAVKNKELEINETEKM